MLNRKSLLFPTLMTLLCIAGCGQPRDDDAASVTTIVMEGPPPDLDDPAHPMHGPHGGELIEFGKNEEYHGELVHGQQDVTIYLLDHSASQPVPIQSETLKVGLLGEGKIQSFDLAAESEEGDPPGRSSRFTSANPQLAKLLDAGVEGRVVVQIDGKSYTGEIGHDHDHSDHDHAGHDH